MRTCTECGVSLPISMFSYTPAGRTTVRGKRCNPCRLSTAAARRRQQRLDQRITGEFEDFESDDGPRERAKSSRERYGGEGEFKHCGRCDGALPITDFAWYRSDHLIRQQFCRSCSAVARLEARERVVAQFGDDEPKRRNREAQQRSRARRGEPQRLRDRAQRKDYELAMRVLRDQNRAEFDRLYQLSKEGKLDDYYDTAEQ